MEHLESIQEGRKKRKFPKRSKRYGPDFKLQVVQKYIEESIPVSVIRQECGLSGGTVGRWVRDYRRHGEPGLGPHCLSHTGRPPPAVITKNPRVTGENTRLFL